MRLRFASRPFPLSGYKDKGLMRNTEKAESFYRQVRRNGMLLNTFELALWVPTSDGNIAMAHALRDIYDKLESLERKLDAVMSDPSRRLGRP